MYSPAEARPTSCIVDIVDIIVDIVDIIVDIVDIIVDIVDIISIHLQHQGAVAQDDAALHVLRHPLALQSAFIVCMDMTVGGRASKEPSRKFRRVLDCEIFANVCLKLYCWSYVVSPGDVVDGGVGGHLALEEHVLPQLHAVTSQAAPEPDPGTRRD